MAVFSNIGTLNITGSTVNIAYRDQTFISSGQSQAVLPDTPSTTAISLPVPWKKTLPRLTTMFTGRRHIIEQLIKYFDRSQSSISLKRLRIFVLYGLGGTGKTQIMLKFVDEFSDQFDEVFYIDASTLETIQSCLEDIARSTSVGETVDDALRWLSQQQKEWLLLFDNADDPTINLRQFIPSCPYGNIIMTSRNQETRVHAPDANCSVSEMQPDDATELLLNYAMVERSDKNRLTCASIAQELGYLALAIAQAGAYIARTSGLNNYLRLYRRNRADLMRRNPVQRTDDYKWSVYTTWEMNLKKLSPTASRLLQLFAFLHNDGIPKAIFERAAAPKDNKDLFQDAIDFLRNFLYEDGTWDELSFLDRIDELSSYSLINVYSESSLYSIHPLVHAWERDRISPAEYKATQTCAMRILALSITHENTTDLFAFRRSLLPHLDQTYTVDMETEVAAKFQRVYAEANRWIPAEKLQKFVVQSRKAELGPEHPDTLTSMADLAGTYRNQGRWQEAEELVVVVLEAQRRLLGDENKDTIESMNILSSTYLNQGRSKEAESLQVEALKLAKKLFGDENEDTLEAMNNLAMTYLEQGHWRDAEALQLQVVEGTRKLLGDEHPDTLSAMSNLAMSYLELGRWDEAEKLLLAVIEARKKVIGLDHADTLASINNLVMTYVYQGRWQEAEALQVEGVELSKKVLGNEHPDVLTIMANLALIYRGQGRLKDAEASQVEILNTRRRLFGDRHSDTLICMIILSLIYIDEGRWHEGEVLQVEATEALKILYGEEHPTTLKSMNNLARTYWRQGRLDEAEVLQNKMVEARVRLFGENHPDTLISMNDLGLTHRDQGRLGEAESLQLKVLTARNDQFGPEHPHTLDSKNSLALTYWSQGRWGEAEGLQVEVVEARERLLGREHPHTLASMADLARTYWSQGPSRGDEAESLAVKVAEVRRRVLGDDHPHTRLSVAFLSEIEKFRASESSASVLDSTIMVGAF